MSKHERDVVFVSLVAILLDVLKIALMHFLINILLIMACLYHFKFCTRLIAMFGLLPNLVLTVPQTSFSRAYRTKVKGTEPFSVIVRIL
jgi:hypothetical protein